MMMEDKAFEPSSNLLIKENESTRPIAPFEGTRVHLEQKEQVQNEHLTDEKNEIKDDDLNVQEFSTNQEKNGSDEIEALCQSFENGDNEIPMLQEVAEDDALTAAKATELGEPAEIMLNKCRELGKIDKLFQLQRLAKQYEHLYPEHFERNKEELGPLLRESEEAVRLLNELDELDQWELILDEDVKVYHRQLEEDRHVHGLMTDFEMEADLNSVLVLLNEIPLYHQWLPFVQGATELVRQSRCESVAWVKIWSPPPFKPRDVCIHARAIDGLDEDGCSVIILKSVEESEYGLEQNPEIAKKHTVRMDMRVTVLQFIPVEGTKTRMRSMSYANPQLPFTDIPSWLLNFICSKIACIGIKMWEKEACAISKGEGKGDHKERMQQNPEFYKWMEGRVDAHFKNQRELL